VVQAYSVNKIAVATALPDKVDRGQLTLDQRVDVTADIVIPDGDGIFPLHGAYPSSVTLGHVLAALLTISDDTAVRLCGLLTTSAEINQILAAKGFPHTQVEPVANPHRFFLGTTTPKEMHGLLQGLVRGSGPCGHGPQVPGHHRPAGRPGRCPPPAGPPVPTGERRLTPSDVGGRTVDHAVRPGDALGAAPASSPRPCGAAELRSCGRSRT
jgi:Beta-lactamase enzyme family